MRNMRSLLATMLAFCLTFGLLPAAQAGPISQPFGAEAGEASGQRGETLSIPVTLKPGQIPMFDDNFWAYAARVDYDPAVLEVDDVDFGSEPASFDYDDNGTGSVTIEADTFGNDVFVDSEQTMFTIKFRIKDDAAAGDTAVTLHSASYTLDQMPVTINTLVSGKVTVLASTPTAEVKIGSQSGQQGSTVKVPVTLSEASAGVGSFGMQIGFDKAKLQVVEIAGPGADIFDSVYDNEDGSLRVAWVDGLGGDYVLQKGQTLFTVTFKLSSSTGIAPLTVADTTDLAHFTFTDGQSAEMIKTLVPGNVTIFAPQSPVNEPAGNGPSGIQPGAVEKITVEVKDRDSKVGGAVAKTEIERTTKADGTKSDKVTLTAEQTKQTIERIAASGSKSADIVIPDTKDEVSEVSVSIPKDAGKLIRDAGIDIGIVTGNVKISIPGLSLQGFEEDIYFHFIPIKEEAEKREVQDRAELDALVREASAGSEALVVGRPMTIETNLQNRKVDLVMPLKGVQFDDGQLANLVIYVEHSDGTKELLRGEIVVYDSATGERGLKFSVDKFSTFSLVYLEPQTGAHAAYMHGYADGSFRPDRAVTRGELAAIVARVVKRAAATDKTVVYRDVEAGSWAAGAIARATAMGLMKGYPNGTFAPDKPVTRAELASLAARISGGSGVGEGFADIAGHWAGTDIRKAQSAGLMAGYPDGTFKPERTITRAETAAVFNKLLGRKPAADTGAAVSPWQDVSKTHWAYANIVEASVDHDYALDSAGKEVLEASADHIINQ